MSIKKLSGNEKGTSEVIGAILLMTILVAFLGMLQAQEVPAWNKEIESAHFNTLYDDMYNLKQILLDTAIYDLPRTVVLHTSFNYPTRMFLMNPSNPSATVSTFKDHQITLIYDDESGTPQSESIDSCSIVIEENYNYFIAPALVMEHGMIIGELSDSNYYLIDAPFLNNDDMDVLYIECENTSVGTTISSNIHLYPDRLSTINVTNASLQFTTDYPGLWGEHFDSIGLNNSLSGNTITVNYSNANEIRTMGVTVGTVSETIPCTSLITSFEATSEYTGSGSISVVQVSNGTYSVEIDYNLGTPIKTTTTTSKNIECNSDNIKLDVYGDGSNNNITLKLIGRAGSEYTLPSTQISWVGWDTIELDLSGAISAGMDLTNIKVEIELSGSGIGTIYYDYLRGTN